MSGPDEADELDAVVIGTGAGGAPLLARLAQAGLRVAALEAGAHHDAAAFAADEMLAAPIYWTQERLAGGADPQAFGANNSGRGVGGSMLHWGAFTPRADPRDLALHRLTGKGVDWPFGIETLLPYYEEVERVLGIAGPDPYPWDPARRYALAPPKRNAPAELMARGCDAVGLRWADAPAAILPAARGDRRACVNCGYCHQGCRIGAKGTMDVSYLPDAVAAGAQIRAGCTATGFERDAAGRIAAVLYRHQDRTVRQKTRAVFLCAGGVETPRLLLATGLANGSGQVGRNYMAHMATQIWGTFEPGLRMNKGYPSSLITEDMLRPPDADFAGGYLIQSLGVVAQTWAENVARGRGLWGTALTGYLDRYNHVAGIGINGDCLPHPDNRLTLTDQLHEDGLPVARIDFTQHDNEIAMRRHATSTMRAIWQQAGGSDLWALNRTAHTIGTARMGTDPAQSVVRPDGRSHDIDNLYICDNSVFPSALAANPALTIMALSLRTADLFLAG